jgi:hypothetical protein
MELFFTEIICPSCNQQQDENQQPELVDVFVSKVEPKYCSQLLKELSQVLPLETTKISTTSTTCNDSSTSSADPSSSIVTQTYINLSHLRRVRRLQSSTTTTTNNNNNNNTDNNYSSSSEQPQHDVEEESSRNPSSSSSSCTNGTSTNRKRRWDGKESYILEVLLGDIKRVQNLPSSTVESLISNYHLVLEPRTVPGRRPSTTTVLLPSSSSSQSTSTNLLTTTDTNASTDLNTTWPLVVSPSSSTTKDKPANAAVSSSSLLLEEELQRMIYGMKESIRDADHCQRQYREFYQQRCSSSSSSSSTSSTTTNDYKNTNESIKNNDPACGGGAVILCSKSNRILSMASKERAEQLQLLQPENHHWMMIHNPLATPVILAIQGISRLERQHAYNEGSITSDTFRNGQYLCTG